MFLRNCLVILSTLFVLGGCIQENGDSNNNAKDFVVTIKTIDKHDQDSKSFVQGEEINIILSIKNISSETKSLNFSSGKQYDFVIKDGAGTEVWRWSNGMAFIQSLTSYNLSSGETRTITYKWNQMISDYGTMIPIGSYVLEGHDIGIDIIPKQDLSII
jgi:hypothetical protein